MVVRVLQNSSDYDGWETERARKRLGARYYLQRHTLSTSLLPPTRSHLLKHLEPPKIVPPGGTKHSTHELVGSKFKP